MSRKTTILESMLRRNNIGGSKSMMIHPLFICFKCNRKVKVKIPSSDDKKVRTAEPDLAFLIQGLGSLGIMSCFNIVLQNLLSLRSPRKEMLGLEFPRAALISIALRKLFVRTNCSNAGT
jgi:hypothetical protein